MTLAWRLLALVLAATGLVGGGYWWGGSAADNRHAAEQLEAERVATRGKFRELERGDAAQADLGQALQAQETAYSHLERAFNELQRRRAPLLLRVSRPAGSSVLAGAPVDASGVAADNQDRSGAMRAGSDLYLSAAAVWVWNSALAGADIPAGACGLADTSEAACAVGTGLTFDAAADNQRENARLCAEDRTRHNKLIDFITHQPLQLSSTSK